MFIPIVATLRYESAGSREQVPTQCEASRLTALPETRSPAAPNTPSDSKNLPNIRTAMITGTHMHVNIRIQTHIYIYIYVDRERERERE